MLRVWSRESVSIGPVSLNRTVFAAALPYYAVNMRVWWQNLCTERGSNNGWGFGKIHTTVHRHAHRYTQGWTSKVSVRSVITSSQRGGKWWESEAPGEKRIMGREWGAVSRPHAEREDGRPRQREMLTQMHTHKNRLQSLKHTQISTHSLTQISLCLSSSSTMILSIKKESAAKRVLPWPLQSNRFISCDGLSSLSILSISLHLFSVLFWLLADCMAFHLTTSYHGKWLLQRPWAAWL